MENFAHFFKTPLFEGNDILQLIPQRSPMVLVDAFYGTDNQHSFSSLTVITENIFCDQGKLSEEGIIEHFAQSAAARIGYIFLQKKEPVPIGFIGAVSKLSIYFLPQLGDKLQTIVTVVQEVGNITLVRVQSRANEEMVAEGELKIYLNREQ